MLALHAALLSAVVRIALPSTPPRAPSSLLFLHPLADRDIAAPIGRSSVEARLSLPSPPPFLVQAPPIFIRQQIPTLPAHPKRPDTALPRPPAPATAGQPTGSITTAPPDQLEAFEARISAAVQRAVSYPAVARRLRWEGRAELRFAFDDGVASDVAILVTSGVSVLDREAIAAVQRAVFPPPPPILSGRRVHLTVWVAFRLVDEE